MNSRQLIFLLLVLTLAINLIGGLMMSSGERGKTATNYRDLSQKVDLCVRLKITGQVTCWRDLSGLSGVRLLVLVSRRRNEKLSRERRRAAGVEEITVEVDREVADALRRFVQFKDMTLGEAATRILRDRLLRKR